MSTDLSPYLNRVICGDCLDVLQSLPDGCVQCCVTSPPYWGLRDYGVEGQLGLEQTPEEYVSKMVEVFREVRRVLKDDGICWVNLGDSYTSGNRSNFGPPSSMKSNACKHDHRPPQPFNLKPKDLVGIPWRVAFALQADGWYLRQDIIWHKPNPMPESVKDRCTKAHEYLFLLSKSAKYFWDAEAIREEGSGRIPGNKKPNRLDSSHGLECERILKSQQLPQVSRNKRSVWIIPTHSFPESHFATFPPKLIEPCILAGSRVGDVVLDPFVGSGTTAVVSAQLGRQYLSIELSPDYCCIAEDRIERETAQLNMFHTSKQKEG